MCFDTRERNCENFSGTHYRRKNVNFLDSHKKRLIEHLTTSEMRDSRQNIFTSLPVITAGLLMADELFHWARSACV